jgi:hypothetical protein
MPYCHRCGKEIDEKARFCPYCGVPVGGAERARELLVEEIEIPYPDAPSVALEIAIGAAGRVHVGGGSEEGFVEGRIEYDVPEWKPRVHVSGGTVRIAQAERWEERWPLHDFVNRWDLRLGDGKPFRLRVKTGVTTGDWGLGGLPITDLRFDTGVSRNRISFDGPNPETMEGFKLGAGVGDVELEGLLDANFRRMEVSGGVGDVTLGFNGMELRQDSTVKVEGGVGSFKIIVDEGVPARATVKGLTSVVALGGFRRRRGRIFGGEYANQAYEGARGSRLEFDITVGVGSVTLDTR